ncbi:MAG: flagellar brake protein [Lachnospiraceae bacterium]|nr:flagellar brake protein [Lachnospiraceae bacterium]
MSNALSIGQKIEMTRHRRTPFGHDGEGKTYVSQLTDIKENSLIQIAMPMEGGRMFLLEPGEKFNLYFYTTRGLFHCVAQVESRYRSGAVYYADMAFLSELERYQRRQFYRLNCIVDMAFRLPEEDAAPYSGVIIDISGGGLRFNSEKQFETDAQLKVSFRLTTGGAEKDFNLLARVVLSNRLVNRESGYETRVEFVDIEENDRESIVKYVFEEDRKRRKRERNPKSKKLVDFRSDGKRSDS